MLSPTSLPIIARDSGEDSEMTLQVHQVLWPRLQAEPGLRRVYEEIELPVSAVLGRIAHPQELGVKP